MISTLPVHYMELEHIYRQLEKRHSKSVAITSCHNQSGSSMLAYSLSKRYQADGYKVLLVDLNIQNPSLNLSLGLARDEWDAGASCMKSICAPSANGTHFLPAPVGNTASLSFRNQNVLAQTIEEWLQHYDRVVMDTSPLNASNYRNIPAQSACAEADASLLLVRSGFTTRNQLEESCQLLQEVKANLLGCIMNDRDHPSLTDELYRENRRLQRFLPAVSAKIKRWIDGSALLNLRI
ncbi:CpsD/CapB family tyrosine-protein kinase [Oceanospirillum sanctuarii]|uniref:CpsD/CapB family tyrosine-protein kinase n=1 Tax=Oceanospirillum sanctuarii TaxID=1434821 RepID=UPI000A3C37B8|nr:CpsD/CapB family tyrosine-protein kinase [Oceanospirillum sanctuarii]